MTPFAHVPLLVSLLLAALSPVLATRLSPARTAAALVAAAAAAAAASTAWALMLLAATFAPTPPVLHEAMAARGGQVPSVIAVAVLLGLAVATIRVVTALRRRHRVARQLRALCETCGVGREELVVAPIAHPQAFAVPGRLGRGEASGGRILVTVGMLRALDAPARRALLDHERAHLSGHHHRHRAIVEIAAALNPLLIPARAAVAYLVERAADEHAAATIGDRRAAANALVTAALAGNHRGMPPDAALAYSRFGVARRVAALQAAPLPDRRLPPILLLALATLTDAVTAHTAIAFSFAEFVHILVPGL